MSQTRCRQMPCQGSVPLPSLFPGVLWLWEPEGSAAHLLHALHPSKVGRALRGHLWLVPWSHTPRSGEVGQGQVCGKARNSMSS